MGVLDLFKRAAGSIEGPLSRRFRRPSQAPEEDLFDEEFQRKLE